ncbi:MAG: AAA family ATPase [Polyangiales bacterium]
MTPAKLKLQARRDAVLQRVLAHVESNQSLLVLKAPPGSGKTYVTTRAVALARHRARRVAVATQTNAQAEDFCVRMAKDFPRFTVHRWASAGGRARSAPRCDGIAGETAQGPCIVVATSAEMGHVEGPRRAGPLRRPLHRRGVAALVG